MPDRGKVIKGIDICLQRFHCGEDCPYYNDGCMEQLREDSLAILKEQEALEERHKALVDAADDLRAELKEANQRIWELICEQDGRHYDDGK